MVLDLGGLRPSPAQLTGERFFLFTRPFRLPLTFQLRNFLMLPVRQEQSLFGDNNTGYVSGLIDDMALFCLAVSVAVPVECFLYVPNIAAWNVSARDCYVVCVD